MWESDLKSHHFQCIRTQTPGSREDQAHTWPQRHWHSRKPQPQWRTAVPEWGCRWQRGGAWKADSLVPLTGISEPLGLPWGLGPCILSDLARAPESEFGISWESWVPEPAQCVLALERFLAEEEEEEEEEGEGGSEQATG